MLIVTSRKGRKGKTETEPSTPSGPSPLPCPRVELESSPLTRHRSTFSASSKDLARHKGGEWLQPTCAHISRTLYSLPLWEGWGGVRRVLTVSVDCLPMLRKMAPRNVMPSLFVCTSEEGCPQCLQSTVRFLLLPQEPSARQYSCFGTAQPLVSMNHAMRFHATLWQE